jgi:hypothetical protein
MDRRFAWPTIPRYVSFPFLTIIQGVVPGPFYRAIVEAGEHLQDEQSLELTHATLPQADQQLPLLSQPQKHVSILSTMDRRYVEQFYQQQCVQQHQDQQVLELQQHLQHQQASQEQIILLKEKLHEVEMSQLKTQIKELRDQLDDRHRLNYQPYERPINQLRYQPQQQINNFNTAQDHNQPPSYQPGMKSNYFI